MRRCLLLDNGTVNYYLKNDDSTKKEDGSNAVLDGTDGQVMVEIPKHYRRHTLDSVNKTYTIEVSLYPFSGAFQVNKCYISAYEATLDSNTRNSSSKLCSIVNNTIRGGNNTSAWDDTYRSLMGMPATSISLTNFRLYARNRNNKWQCNDLSIHNSIYWLYTIEYANLNCQATYNANLTVEGYHQGGLGAGVTSISNWNGYNGYNPVIPCGVTNSNGNNTGVVTHNVIASDGVSTYYAAPVPTYRGIENPFGHIWKWTDGVLYKGTGTAQEIYTCYDRTQYASALNSSYE